MQTHCIVRRAPSREDVQLVQLVQLVEVVPLQGEETLVVELECEVG